MGNTPPNGPVLKDRVGSGPPAPVQALKDHGEDFIVERDLRTLVRRMNELTGDGLIDFAALEAQIFARDREVPLAPQDLSREVGRGKRSEDSSLERLGALVAAHDP